MEEKQIVFENIIEIKNLTKDYDLGEFYVRAIDDISLEVKPNEFLVINGPSGSGKTTLISIIAGLESATEGEVFIEGVKVSDFGEDSFCTFRLVNIGYIFQNFGLISSLTAKENIMFPMQLANVELEKQNTKTQELLDLVNLSEREDHLPFQLSAGEQQRVGIARALANDPPIILADEPTANLDKKNAEFIANLFQDISIKNNKTILMVSHDENIQRYAHRVLTLDEAKIVKEITNKPKK